MRNPIWRCSRGGCAALAASLVATGALAQTPRTAIDPDTLRRDLTVIASDLLGGRGTGSDGFLEATRYAAGVLARAGLGAAGDEIDPATNRAGATRSFIQTFTVPPGPSNPPTVSYNVLALIEGSDPALRSEIVSVGAHLDGLGIRSGQIHNGANDNGTGSVAVLELARVLHAAAPRRSVLVALWGAEEGGLHGSRHFMAHPTLDIGRIVAHVNLDGVGRFDRSPPDSTVIYAIGADKACPDFVSVLEHAVARSPRFGIRTNDPNNWFRASDHYNFFTAGVPSLFLTDLGSEDYHRPADDVDRIDFARLAEVARVAERVIRELADRDRAICR